METIKKRTRRHTSKPYQDKQGRFVVNLSRGMVSIISEQDVKKVSEHVWCYAVRGYAVSRIDGKIVYLHRFILGLNNGTLFADHINRDKLDNRRENLRTCTQEQNQANKGAILSGLRKSKTGIKGVWKVPKYVHKTKPWCAMHKHKNLGYFLTKKEAAIAWNIAAKDTYGEFAYQNAI